ncbi:MAG: helix-turn-helix domain-containing protein [Planctomycetaceae bacterium]|nr:helix-turn-helix domain-containing protein [Planctomycetaceae bacterium]
MQDLISPKQVAQAIGVSESSLKRWCDRGILPSVKTAGGHRRIPVSAVLAYVRETGQTLAEPELLGLSRATTGVTRTLDVKRERLIEALLAGDETVASQTVLNLYLAKYPLSTICDDVLAPVFAEIGERWGCGDVAVYQERRACEICQRLLHEVRRALPEPKVDAPFAIGGTLDGDPYTLATAMVELVLRDKGWRACSLGNMLPFQTLRMALCESPAKLFWLSVTSIRDEETFLSEFARISEMAEQRGVAVVVGGKALTESIRRRMRYSCYCDTFGHLETFAKSHPSAPAAE